MNKAYTIPANVVKLDRVNAFAPTCIDQLDAGMMVKFIGHQKFGDMSPVLFFLENTKFFLVKNKDI